MSLISPNFGVKLIIFAQFWPGTFSQNCWKKPSKTIVIPPTLSGDKYKNSLYSAMPIPDKSYKDVIPAKCIKQFSSKHPFRKRNNGFLS